jgi:indole-3-glycerol phosphate synthase
VLTDRPFFQGAPEDLALARDASALPVLRKDFIVDAYQIAESRAMGADAVLLIVAALDRAQLEDYGAAAREWGMDVLMEVHTAAEAETALAIGADLVGVNNRDLGTFQTSLEVSEALIPILAPHAFVLSESALRSKDEIDRVQRAGARGVLIGTTFCGATKIESKVREVMGW